MLSTGMEDITKTQIKFQCLRWKVTDGTNRRLDIIVNLKTSI